MNITPITAIFGANASGKSNFCQAIKFARDFILWDDMSNLEIFLLDNESKAKPSVFKFEILVDEIVYEFSFSIFDHKILEEKLIKITSYTEVTLYERHNHVVCYNDFVKSTPRDTIALGYIDIPEVQQIYNWFKDLVFFEDQIDCSIQQVNEILHTIDSRIGKIPFSMKKESTGIKKLIKLLPFFVILLSEQSKKVVVVDDLDQNLHISRPHTRYHFEYHSSHLYLRQKFQP